MFVSPSAQIDIDIAGWEGFDDATATARLLRLQPPADIDGACPQCPGSYYDPSTPARVLCCSNPPWKPGAVVPTEAVLNGTTLVAPPYSYNVLVFTLRLPRGAATQTPRGVQPPPVGS